MKVALTGKVEVTGIPLYNLQKQDLQEKNRQYLCCVTKTSETSVRAEVSDKTLNKPFLFTVNIHSDSFIGYRKQKSDLFCWKTQLYNAA